MDPLTTIMLWALLCALVVAVIVAGGVLDAALIKLSEKAEPPGERDTEETPVSDPPPMSEMEPEYIQELRSITPTQYKAMYLGDWLDQRQEEE